jgi:hypothetical protein
MMNYNPEGVECFISNNMPFLCNPCPYRQGAFRVVSVLFINKHLFHRWLFKLKPFGLLPARSKRYFLAIKFTAAFVHR